MKSSNKMIHNFLIEQSKRFPLINNEIEKNGVLKIKKQNLDLFSFIAKTIISQQISDQIAQLLWKRLCAQLNTKIISIESFKNINYLKNILTKTKISQPKINYISDVYIAFTRNEIMDYTLYNKNDDEIISLLLNFRGIGPWTCNMLLIFYYEKLNIFPENDLIIKKTLDKLNILEKKKINFRKTFSPFLSIFSLHLWKMSKRIL